MDDARRDFEARLAAAKRALLSDLRNEYESAIKRAAPAALKQPIVALRARSVRHDRKVIREASIVGQSMIMDDFECGRALLAKPRSRPSFAISVNENSILIDRVDISSKGPDVVGNIIKEIQNVLKKHYRA